MPRGRVKNEHDTTYKRFLKNFTIVESGCWEWHGNLDRKGYGTMRAFVGHKTTLAHRISYRIYIGELVPRYELVCHKCDNPKCVNPFHLFKGTHLDNHHDAQFKGRLPIAKHPSQTFYDDGCRCDECKAINKKRGFEKVTMKYRNDDQKRLALNAIKRAYYAKTQQHQVEYRKMRRRLGLGK